MLLFIEIIIPSPACVLKGYQKESYLSCCLLERRGEGRERVRQGQSPCSRRTAVQRQVAKLELGIDATGEQEIPGFLAKY